MAVNLSALSTVTTTATTLSNLILVTPLANDGYQPDPKVNTDGSRGQQPPSFVFNYEGENTFLIESDITDHFIETNSPVNDQIALRPEIITVHGFVGELNDVVPTALIYPKLAADKLLILSAYTPAISTTALDLYNNAAQLYQVAQFAFDAAVSTWGTITDHEVQNLQQQAFSYFYGYYKQRRLFTVQTPWCKMEDMAIKSIRFIQDDSTRMITDFEITFKKMNFVDVSLFNTPIVLGDFQSRAASQAAASDPVNNAISTPAPSTNTLAGSTAGIA